MTYQDLKTLEANKVITVKTVENWSKADNGRCYRIVTANFGKTSLYFIEYEYVDMLRFSTYITSTNKLLSACAGLAQKAFKKLENKLEIINCNKLNNIIEANESAAQAEETNQQENNVMRTMNNEKLTQVLTSAISQSSLVAASKVAKVVGIGEYSIEWGKLADIMSSFIEEANNILPCDHQAESREMEKDLDNLFAETKERIISLIEK